MLIKKRFWWSVLKKTRYFLGNFIQITQEFRFNTNTFFVSSNYSVVWLTLDSANHCPLFHPIGQWFGQAAPVVDGDRVGACDRGERAQASGFTFTRAHRNHGGRVSRRSNRSDPRHRPGCFWYSHLRTHTPAEQPVQGMRVCSIGLSFRYACITLIFSQSFSCFRLSPLNPYNNYHSVIIIIELLYYEFVNTFIIQIIMQLFTLRWFEIQRNIINNMFLSE